MKAFSNRTIGIAGILDHIYSFIKVLILIFKESDNNVN
jgi:hypothetical protein